MSLGNRKLKANITVFRNKNTLFLIPGEVFELVFLHTIARNDRRYAEAIQKERISIVNLKKLCNKAQVPYPLLLATPNRVKKVINYYEKAVFSDVNINNKVSISARGSIDLADISLVLRDIHRKREYLRKKINSDNKIRGILKNISHSTERQVEYLRTVIDFKLVKYRKYKRKEEAFQYLVDCLADKNIFVTLYVHQQCPQTIDKQLDFSGIAISDKKAPFLFVKTPGDSRGMELWGRRTFTVVLLLICLAKGKNGPISMKGFAKQLIDNDLYIVAEEFLLPEKEFVSNTVDGYYDIKQLANLYKVSPSAVVMRAFRFNMIDEIDKQSYLSSLVQEFYKAKDGKGYRDRSTLERKIIKYNNPKVTRIIVEDFMSKRINENRAQNLLCYRKGDKFSKDKLLQELQ